MAVKDLTRVWLVEVWNPDKKRWEVYPYGGLKRNTARAEAEEFRRDNPFDQFRVRRYTRAD